MRHELCYPTLTTLLSSLPRRQGDRSNYRVDAAGAVTYRMADAKGSTQAPVDVNRTIVGSYRYEAFGGVRSGPR